MRTNVIKFLCSVLVATMMLSSFVILPVSAAELAPLPDPTEDYTSGVFIVCRTIDESGNETDPLLYKGGDKIIFELAAYDKELNRLAVEGFTYSLYDDAHGNDAFATGSVKADAVTGVGLVETVAMDQPGMLRITADIADAEGNLLREYRADSGRALLQGGVLIDAGNIGTVVQEPEDFDEFWADSIALLPSADLVGLREVQVPEKKNMFKAYEVYVNCYGLESDTKSGETYTAGYLAFPKDAAKGSLGISVNFQGQGLSPIEPRYVDNTITFNCLAHSVDLAELITYKTENNPGSKADYYNYFLNLAEDDKATWGEDTYGMSPTVNADREKVYYRQMLLRDYQAVEFLLKYFSSTSDATEYNGIDVGSWAGLWNGTVVDVSGGSQGGFQAIGVAALHPAVTSMSASIPWLCDIGAGTTKAPVGTYIGSGNRPAYAAGLDYVDSAFLAKRITCKTEITAGLGDPTCPPSGVMAMYNNLANGKSAQDGPYSLKFTQSMVHGYSTFSSDKDIQKSIEKFIGDYCSPTLNGAFGSDDYIYSVNESVLNIISENDNAVLEADEALVDFAMANAEKIKTVEVEGKFDCIKSLKPLLEKLTRVENIKIDVQTTTIAEGATNVFAGGANLVSLGHVEFDAMGAPVADSGTYKKGEVNLEGFVNAGDAEGILSGDRAVVSVVVPGTSIPARAFENNVSLETVYLPNVSDNVQIAADAFVGTSGVKIIVDKEVAVSAVEDVLAEAGITNVTVSMEEGETGFGDKTGAAGTNAKWKIKGSTLIISGTGAVTKLEALSEEDKGNINNIVIADGITSISNGVIDGFTLESVSLKGIILPTADDKVFGDQSAEFVVYVTPDAQDVGDTVYGYVVVVDGGTAGDLSGDGSIDAVDAVTLAQVIAGWEIEYNKSAADCNGDGEVNAVDAVLLAQYIAGWEVELGVTAGGGDIEIPGSDLLD